MSKKGKKADNVGKKIIRFFGDIKSELKKVIWPDRKKLVQSTITVISICVIMAALVFTIDKVLEKTLTAVGFFPKTSTETQSNLPISLPGTSKASSVESKVEVSEESSANETSSDLASQSNSVAD